MARPKSDGATATAERKPRAKKSPKEKAETLTVRVCNALDSLGYMAAKLTEPQREAIHTAIEAKLKELDEAFAEHEEENEEPEPFALPD